MDDFYMVVRTFNFLWGAILFMAMCWYGTIDILLARRCSHVHVSPEHQLWAGAVASGIFGLIVGLAEIFLQEANGGIRVFVFMPMLLLSTLALRHGIARVRDHRIAVEKGACQ